MCSSDLTVRLAGLDLPSTEQASAARAALDSLVAGRPVTLRRLGPDSDRHGRLLAEVAVDDISVQVRLLALGQARVAGRLGDAACILEWLQAERSARAAGLGLWGDPHYVIREAEQPDKVLAERGRFTLVEGKVLSVRESGGTIYVNFGRRWSDDFTATVRKRDERAFAAAGLVLKALSGRHVRVRGVIEERGGPWIEVSRPEQIEIAERN